MRKLLAVAFLAFFATTVRAQITNVTNDQASPTPGAGHNYIGALSEIVNPANGSLSIRLDVPMPGGRGIALPFHFSYNSSGVFQFQTINFKLTAKGGADQGFMEHAGWGYSVPTFNSGIASIPSQNPVYPNESCPVNTEFVFTDEDGSRHALPLAIANQSQCSQVEVYPTVYYSANDGVYAAWTQNGAQDAYLVPFSVQDKSGTVYHFSQLGNATGTGNTTWTCLEACSIPDFIEDRNGNKITFSAGIYGIPLTETDTAGRSALSISAFGSAADLIATSALANPYTVDWGTNATYNFTFTANPEFFNDSYCGTLTLAQPAGSFTTVTSIKMPNNEEYKFYYDSTYGLLNEIVYPTGGYVKYTWNISDLADSTYWADSKGNPGACAAQYSSPAILHRYVSFDGSTTALQQDFAYTTNWNPSKPTLWLTKQTIITTTDFKQPGNPSFQTTYTYSPTQIPTPPDVALALNTYAATQVPQEQTIVYKDWNGSTLQTVSKSWSSLYTLGSQQLTLGGQTNKVGYSYQGLSVMSEKDEYDFGTGGNPGPLLRKTVFTFSAPVANPLGAKIWDRPSSVVVYDGSSNRMSETDYSYDQTATSSATATNHDETNFGTTFLAPRGNVTSETKQCFPSCANAVSVYTHDETGHVITFKDPNVNTTIYSYLDSYTSGTPPGNTNAYLTQVTRPVTNGVNHVSNYSYAYLGGQLTVAKDENGRSTTYAYADSLGRPTAVSYPDTGQTTYAYNDAPPTPSVTTTTLATPDPTITNVSTTDGMGHTIQHQITSVSPSITDNDTVYDGLARPYHVYNPTQCNPPTTNCGESTWGYASYTYDSLGRTTAVTEPDGSPVTMSYAGNCTTVTDEAGKTRESCNDGLGRMTEVIENPAGLGYVTNYSYDALDDLLGVVEDGSHNRAFVYDSQARLTSSTNPENGQIKYTYDSDGNLQTRTDARSIVTTYTVDALNRVTQEAYSDGVTPTAQFLFDTASTHGVVLANPIGRLSLSNTNVVESLFSYDPLGRVVTYMQTTPQHNSIAFSTSYVYDLAGDVTSFTNGLGPTFSYTIDGAGRTTQVSSNWSDSNHPAMLATVNSSVGFWPTGMIRDITLGNGLTQTSVLNNRLQPCRLNVNSSSTALGTCTGAIPSGNVQDFNYGFNSGTTNNGSVMGWTATGQQSFNRTYTYDQLNRLSTMGDSASNQTCKGLSWVYDAWGNRTAQNVTSGSCLSPQTPVNANNQLIVSGYTYDAAGNLTHDASHSYTYDAENRLTKVDGGSTATYTYDATGHRVEKPYPGGGYVDYLYDLAGNVEGEWIATSAVTGPEAEYVYLNGQLIAEYIANTTYFIHKDHLGSTRLITGVTKSIIDNMDYLPFGEQTTGDTSITHKFAGKERDPETASTPGGLNGLDNFEARYMTSRLGRFMSPDPGNAGALNSDPQSWNGYAYVRNNPINLTDSSGRVFCRPGPESDIYAGVSLICDVSDSDYVNSSEDQQKAYDQAGYTHYDCSCDTGADRDAFQHPQGNASNDYVGDVLVFAAALGLVRGVGPATDEPRLPQDQKRQREYPNPPEPNNGNGTIGTNPNQAAELQRDLEEMQREGYTDIRTNQEQVNAQGVRVGQGRPDLQGTDPQGIRHYFEYDQDPASGAAHKQRILANDPAGVVTTKNIK
jgi:RHS repeat-associated protein